MKSRVYWVTLLQLWAATLLSVVVVASAAHIGIVGLYTYSVLITSFVGLRLFRLGSDYWKFFLLVTIPALTIVAGGWVWCHRAIEVFQAREGPVYLGNVALSKHYEHWACEVPLVTTSLLLGLHLAILTFVLVVMNKGGQTFLAALLVLPLALFNFIYFISASFDYFD